MEYDMKLGKILAEELIDLWNDCFARLEKIDQLIRQLRKTSNNKKYITDY